MKNLSAILALAILLTVGLACSDSDTTTAGNQSGNSNSGTTTSSDSKSDASELKIDRAEMRKDDGGGEMSDETTDTFASGDRKFHCYVSWENPKAGVPIKIIYTAINAGGAKNQKLKEFSLTTTDEFQNYVSGFMELRTAPPKGDYKVEVYVNDKLAKTINYKVV